MKKQPVVISQRGRQFATSAIALQGIIINEAEQVLLLSSARRGDHGWQTVSGGLEAGETILDGMLREVREEVGDVTVRPLTVLHSHTFHYDENVPFMVGIYYLLRYEGGEVVPGDDMAGSDFKWWGLDELETAVAHQKTRLHFSTHLWMLRRAVELNRFLWTGGEKRPFSNPHSLSLNLRTRTSADNADYFCACPRSSASNWLKRTFERDTLCDSLPEIPPKTGYNPRMNPIRLELPTEFDVGPVNCYLFTAPEPVLVDCGVELPQSWDALLAGLAQHNLTPADIRRIVITHPHVDHSGQAAKIAALSGCQVWIADLGYEWLVKPQKMFGLRADYYRHHFLVEAGIPDEMAQMIQAYFAQVGTDTTPVPSESVQTFQVGDWLEMGGARWQALHMPGHASHQTCFYQPETRQFLSADMLLARTPTPIVERPLPNQPRQPSLPIFMDSLDRCEALDMDWVYPGHGEPFQNHRQLIQKQRNRIHKRKGEALALIQQGHHTAYALMNEMYAHYPPQFRFAGLWMLIGYLDLLQAEGKVGVEIVDGVLEYYVNMQLGN